MRVRIRSHAFVAIVAVGGTARVQPSHHTIAPGRINSTISGARHSLVGWFLFSDRRCVVDAVCNARSQNRSQEFHHQIGIPERSSNSSPVGVLLRYCAERVLLAQRKAPANGVLPLSGEAEAGAAGERPRRGIAGPGKHGCPSGSLSKAPSASSLHIRISPLCLLYPGVWSGAPVGPKARKKAPN